MDPRIAARRRNVAEHRVRSNLGRITVVLVLLGLTAAGVWFVRSPYMAVEQVVLTGAEASKAAEILTDAGVVPGRPLVDIDPEDIESALLADSRIATAEVRRDWPDTVQVRVEEREPVAWVETPSGWLHLAADGVILARGEPGERDPLVRAAGLVAEDASTDRRVLAALEFVVGLPPSLVPGTRVVAGEVEMSAIVAGYDVRLGRAVEMPEKARAVAAVVAEAPEPGSQITVVAPTRPAILPPTTTTTTTEAG